MQDIKLIKQDPEAYKELVRRKNLNLDVDELLSLYDKLSILRQELDELRSKRNLNAGYDKVQKGRPEESEILKGKELKKKIAEKEAIIDDLDKKYMAIMWRTPQIVSSDTPVGKDERENVEVKKWSPDQGEGGAPLIPDFQIKDHIALGTELGILDLERGVKTAGFRGYYLKNEGALLHMGIMMFGLKLIQSKGFDIFIPPTLVREQALWGSGHFPFDEDNVYSADSLRHTREGDDNEKRYLIGTAEPSLLYYRAEEVIDESELPLKYAGYSPCYRSEIGSYGKDTKGIYRIHEFMKIEQVVMCENDYEISDKLHQLMLSYSEELLQKLKLPYRIIQLCTGDMGAGKYKMFDIETWMPSRKGYGETHSASNLGDWQTRRLNIKVRRPNGEKYYPHALNNTVVASPRILIAVLENYQNKDGSVRVPEVLQEYVGKERIEKRDLK